MEEYYVEDDEDDFPQELDHFNWGAFLLNWIWGLGNNTMIALLCLVPILNIAMPFVLGFKGNQWAWQNNSWKSIEHFKNVQRKWAIAGVLVFIGVVFACILSAAIFFGIFMIMKKSDAHNMAVQVFNKSTICQEYTGSPVETGFPMGTFHVSPSDGYASMSFSVEGHKGSGRLYYEATKSMGEWKIIAIKFKDDKTGKFHKLDPADVNSSGYESGEDTKENADQ